jgi:hypothetical protein
MARAYAKIAALKQVLVYYDGPQLALLKTEQDTNLLALAIDSDTSDFAYFCTEVTDKVFRFYKDGRYDLNYLFRFSRGRRHFFFDWRAMKDGVVALRRATPEMVADDDNYPEPGFFEENHTEAWDTKLAPSQRKKFFIQGKWDSKDFSRFHDKVGDIYSFLSMAEDLAGEEIGISERRQLIEALSSPSFAGGGSYVGFYSDISSHSDSIRPLRITGLQYNSPGHIEVEGRESVFADLDDVLSHFEANLEPAKTAYGAVATTLTQEGLRTADNTATFSNVLIRDYVLTKANELAQLLKIDNSTAVFQASAQNVLVYAKIIMAHYRRVRDLYMFMAEGRLTLTAQNAALG